MFDLLKSQEYNRYQSVCPFIANKENNNVNHVSPKTRPKNLNLLTIRFPIPAIISILHRISGFVLFLIIPLVLWGFEYSLTEDGYNTLQQGLDNFWLKLFFWILLVPFCYHLVAGIRHLLSDIHVGVALKTGRLGAKLVIILSILLAILAGVWLW